MCHKKKRAAEALTRTDRDAAETAARPHLHKVWSQTPNSNVSFLKVFVADYFHSVVYFCSSVHELLLLLLLLWFCVILFVVPSVLRSDV